MKYLLTSLLCSVLALGSWAQSIPELKDIEACYDAAFNESFPANTNKVRPIIEKLAEAYQENPSPWLIYWQAYGTYFEGIYLMKTDQKDASEEALREGIAMLEEKELLNSEDHVLIGTLMGVLMGVSPGSVMTLSSKSSKHYKQALKKQPDNMRVYLALGKSDYYKPKMFGGGKKVEEYLLKALSLEDTYDDNPNGPTWGREEAYSHLVQYYQREDKLEEAKLYCKKGLDEFPEDYMLNQLQNQL